MRTALDRRAAVAALLVSAVAIAMPVAVSRAPLPSTEGSTGATDSTGDTEVLAALVDAAERSRSATWLVEFAYTREVPGAVGTEGTVIEANRPPLRVTATDDSLTAELGATTLRCALTDDGPQCSETVAESALRPAVVYETAVRLGAYAVERAARLEVAGEPADCYALVSRLGGALPGLGLESGLCFAADGVPLWSRVALVGATDKRVASRVERDVSDADLRALLARFGAQDRLPG